MLVLADWGWSTPSTLGAAQIKIITPIITSIGTTSKTRSVFRLTEVQ